MAHHQAAHDSNRASPSLARCALLFATAVSGTAATAPDFMVPRLYQVTTETVMPHLEENLRYAITHEERCLAEHDLATEFPILAHPALQGCALEHATRRDEVISYTLICTGAHGTTGNAIWELGERQVTGTLNVK